MNFYTLPYFGRHEEFCTISNIAMGAVRFKWIGWNSHHGNHDEQCRYGCQ